MQTSDTINEIAEALAKAQAKMAGAIKDSENPHFRSRYADLASVREACMGALNAEGIGVLQSPRLVDAPDTIVVELETRFVHRSGQWVADHLRVPVSKPDAQGVGSAITYARRYALAAFAGVAPEDDDAEAAVGRPTPTRAAVSDGPLTVIRADSKPTSNGKVQWTVGFSDGVTATTITERVGLLAEEAKVRGHVVTRRIETKGQYTNLVSLSTVKPVPTPVEPIEAPSVTDIPF